MKRSEKAHANRAARSEADHASFEMMLRCEEWKWAPDKGAVLHLAGRAAHRQTLVDGERTQLIGVVPLPLTGWMQATKETQHRDEMKGGEGRHVSRVHARVGRKQDKKRGGREDEERGTC